MKWYEDYDAFLHRFEIEKDAMDETVFYFKTDPDAEGHYIGCMSEYETPYWAGLCDVEDGCDFSTARELLEAPIYDGRSLKDRWEEVCICQIGGYSADDW